MINYERPNYKFISNHQVWGTTKKGHPIYYVPKVKRGKGRFHLVYNRTREMRRRVRQMEKRNGSRPKEITYVHLGRYLR